jgi:hypothetical protein
LIKDLRAQCQECSENVMEMKSKWRTPMFWVFLGLAMGWGNARADEVPLVNGEHWTKSTEQLKRVYLIGFANALQLESAYGAAKPPSDDQSLVPRFARGLKGQTLDGVRDGLDKWYAASPGRLQRPVVETMWFEMVVPALAKNP